jgi:nucleoside-diphosphate-sugar epimerase
VSVTGHALVTGSAGFVGRHMIRRLVADGWVIAAMDIASDRRGDDVRRAWDWTVPAEPFDLAVHCAAVVGGRALIDGAPLELACHDLAIDAAFFDWCRRARPRHVVYYSSSAAYPVRYQSSEYLAEHNYTTSTMWPLNEANIGDDGDNIAMPDQTYGWVKLTGERLARELALACPDVSVHVLRPFSGYGEDQDLHYPFPAIALRAARGDRPVAYWGHPDQTRDWVHIDDVIGATLAVVEADHRAPVNICTGVPTRFADLARLLATIGTGEPAVTCEAAGNPSGVHYRVGDPSAMLQFYTPTITVEEGALRAVAYAKEHRC